MACRVVPKTTALFRIMASNTNSLPPVPNGQAAARSVAQARLSVTLSHLSAQTRSQSTYTAASTGSKYTTNYENYCVQDSNKIVSYFHDVPLALDRESRTATMIVEIPRWTNGKFEIDPKRPGNPIVQDVKNGEVRYVRNLFPFHGYIHNYGAFPQTWEDPTVKHDIEELYGDGDPLDVCEIGSAVLATGTIRTVKILGSLALVDDGELDWKVIVVDTADPLANELHDIHDVFVTCPGLLESTRQWFREYKLPDGKPLNKLALNGAYCNSEQTVDTIIECHEAWKRLVSGKSGKSKFSIANTSLHNTPGFIDSFDFNDSVLGGVRQPDAPIPDNISKSHYLSK